MSQAGEGLGHRGAIRISLADLAVWVLGVGVLCGLWQRLQAGRWFHPPVDVDRVQGLCAVGLAVSLVLGLSRQAFVLAGGRREVAWRAIPLAWRVVATLLLGLFIAEELVFLQDEPTGLAAREPIRGRGILPLAGALGMTGVAAGLSGGQRGTARSRRGSVVWAALSGLAMATAQMMIPYLVLLAMAAVENALYRTDWAWRARPTIDARLLHAGLEVVPAAVCCLALALRLSDEFTNARVGSRSKSENLGLWIRSSLVAIFGAWLLWVTIPRISPWLSEGIGMVVSPDLCWAIVLGFAGLSFGIVARASVPAQETRNAEGSKRSRGLRVIGLVMLVLTGVEVVLSLVMEGLVRGGILESSGSHGFGGLIVFGEWLLSSPRWLSDRIWGVAMSPCWLVLAILEAWLAWRIGGLLVTPPSHATPIDLLLADRGSVRTNLTRWLALTVLMLAALPTLFVAGLVSFHLVIRRLG